MSLWSRIRLMFKVKTRAALERAEDPREVMDYAYGQQQELLLKTRQGLIEVATAKAQLEQQSHKLHSRVPKMEEQAKRRWMPGAKTWHALPCSVSRLLWPGFRTSTINWLRWRRRNAS